MLFQNTEMSFNETCHVMVHCFINIMTADGAKKANKMP